MCSASRRLVALGNAEGAAVRMPVVIAPAQVIETVPKPSTPWRFNRMPVEPDLANLVADSQGRECALHVLATQLERQPSRGAPRPHWVNATGTGK
jgi:hypothetical protein